MEPKDGFEIEKVLRLLKISMGTSHMEQLNVLREQNKDLLKQLKQKNEAFELLSDCTDGRVEKPKFQDVTGEDCCSIQAASAEPSVLSADKVFEHKVSPPSLTAEQRQESAKCSMPSDLTTKGRSIHDNSTRHHFPPLLGYDWIAGVLEIEDSVIERSDEFFKDLSSFRSHNKKECVHNSRTEFFENPLGPSVVRSEDDPQVNVDTHQCTYSYRMNSRLFPIPLHMERCPVCKEHRSAHPPTLTNPALIRVGIPFATVLPAHKYRAHRRCSFNPSDSLGLPSHCLTGWSSKGQITLPAPTSLDLRTSVSVKEGFSVPQASKHEMSNVSGLTRHSFPRFSRKKRRADSTFKASH